MEDALILRADRFISKSLSPIRQESDEDSLESPTSNGPISVTASRAAIPADNTMLYDTDWDSSSPNWSPGSDDEPSLGSWRPPRESPSQNSMGGSFRSRGDSAAPSPASMAPSSSRARSMAPSILNQDADQEESRSLSDHPFFTWNTGMEEPDDQSYGASLRRVQYFLDKVHKDTPAEDIAYQNAFECTIEEMRSRHRCQHKCTMADQHRLLGNIGAENPSEDFPREEGTAKNMARRLHKAQRYMQGQQPNYSEFQSRDNVPQARLQITPSSQHSVQSKASEETAHGPVSGGIRNLQSLWSTQVDPEDRDAELEEAGGIEWALTNWTPDQALHQLFDLSEIVLGLWVPYYGHAVAYSMDAIGNAAQYLWKVEAYDIGLLVSTDATTQMTVENSFADCNACSAGKIYDRSEEALRHVHGIHMVHSKEQAEHDQVEEMLDAARIRIVLGSSSSKNTGLISLEPVGLGFLVAAIAANLQDRPLQLENATDPINPYKQYVSRLQFLATTRPKRRLYLELNSLHGEIQALRIIKPRLDRQIHFRVESSFIDAQMTKLHDKIIQLEHLEHRTQDIKSQVAQIVEIIDEDHGKAIRVFTFVTVIFLPMSFMTSFLGMNTTDIASINQDSGFFWMISIPLTVAVVGTAYIYGYKWESIMESFNRHRVQVSHSTQPLSQQHEMEAVVPSAKEPHRHRRLLRGSHWLDSAFFTDRPGQRRRALGQDQLDVESRVAKVQG
ncbi:uncharacterized protein JN550_006458 [Neoarthrinium moseri]|uniref:uncharacterized protein n=1 Tax=Neoarthrinium moseri TaxID=1658444 RepID=UPI001FDDACC6|nr:uncharacterized protein JN550_006458 [Neoarthrinium moseri]KAI1868542.1 hypothetical protein JN550_006458 [Neoarthrinium moseri]